MVLWENPEGRPHTKISKRNKMIKYVNKEHERRRWKDLKKEDGESDEEGDKNKN